jgi:hypothetical protein
MRQYPRTISPSKWRRIVTHKSFHISDISITNLEKIQSLKILDAVLTDHHLYTEVAGINKYGRAYIYYMKWEVGVCLKKWAVCVKHT